MAIGATQNTNRVYVTNRLAKDKTFDHIETPRSFQTYPSNASICPYKIHKYPLYIYIYIYLQKLFRVSRLGSNSAVIELRTPPSPFSYLRTSSEEGVPLNIFLSGILQGRKGEKRCPIKAAPKIQRSLAG